MKTTRKEYPRIHLNLRVRGTTPSATIAIQERCRLLKQEGREVFRLGLGQSPFPIPECVVKELRAHAHEKAYLPVKGLPALREAIAAHHRKLDGLDCTVEDVIVGPGSKELMFLLQLVFYGDILIPTPTWVSYQPQADIIGRRVFQLPTLRENKWKILPADLTALCKDDPSRPRLLILNYPANPGGGTYGPGELAALAEAAHKYHVVVLSDEIYGKLNFYGNHESIGKMYPEGTIVSGGISKWCGAGGWRLGFFIVPKGMRWLLDAMAAVASETYTSTSAPIQYAAVRAFQDGEDLEDYLTQCRRILISLGNHIADKLEAAGVEVSRPLGGFYLFPDFTPLSAALRQRGIRGARALCETILDETGVAILPGSDFGRKDSEFTARLAYVDFDGGEALKAANAIREDQPIPLSFLEAKCLPTVTAIDRLCAWLAEL